MKVLLAQTNTTPGDFSGNIAQIENGIKDAALKKADMVVFPELSICGYLCKDMMFQHQFIDSNLQALHRLVNLSLEYDKVAIVVGYIDRNKTGVGKPFRNMLAVIQNGILLGEYQKHLLPFYDVFDEGRYFEPGKELLILRIAGERVAFSVCEDVWNTDKGSDDLSYIADPIAEYRKRGIDTLVNISSSPFVNGKPLIRYRMLERVAHDFTLIYVNQHGGQDDLVFDGHSCVIRNGSPVAIIPTPTTTPYAAIHKFVDTKERIGAYVPLNFNLNLRSEIEMLYEMTKMGLHDYLSKSGFKTVVLGSSGGIDSALVATLACEVLGPENVHCIMMPSVYSSEHSITDAKELHANLGCNQYLIPVDHKSTMCHINNSTCQTNRDIQIACHNFTCEGEEERFTTPYKFNKSAEENLQARMRGVNIMFFSNAWGALALTTGNKTELATGYCTLYGDMNGGFAPISDLYKMQVREMCKFINTKKKVIPLNVIEKPPSAELSTGQTDEASLLPYPILDQIVKQYVENYVDSYEEFVKVSDPKILAEHFSHGNQIADYRRIIHLINVSEFKRRQSAPGIKLSRVAFGTGRRIPICKK